MTILNDVVFPDTIASVGISGARKYTTLVTELANGYEQRTITQEQPRRRYEVELKPESQTSWATIANMYEVVKGRGYGFRFKDPTDYSTTQTTGFLRPLDTLTLTSLGSLGVGYGVPKAILTKKYISAGNSSERWLTRPRASTYTIYRAASPLTEGVSATNYALDTTTGIVTFVADSSSTVTAVTVGATTQVTLTGALAGLSVGHRLYLSGLTGTHANLLNSLSHEITNISVNTYTLATNTVGKTITAAGSGYKFPQADQALTLVTEFDVPVRFDSDELPFSVVATGSGRMLYMSTGNVPLIEVRE